MPRERFLILLALFQGLYYLVTGIWPLISMATFQMVTGPKVDLWLVKTAGILIAVTGIVLLTAFFRKTVCLEIVILAVGNALGLAGIDIYYSWNTPLGTFFHSQARLACLFSLNQFVLA